MLGLTLLPAGSGLAAAEAVEGVELSRDPLPAPGGLHAARVRLFGIALGDTKAAVLRAARARKLLIEDETDAAFDVVYLYRDRIALRSESNLAAYRIRGGAVEAISLFGRMPRSTNTVSRFKAVAPGPLRELLRACNEPGVRERILGVAEQSLAGGTAPERTETYRYDNGRIELEYTLYQFQHPQPSTSETCRLTFQRGGK